jgi:DNA-binding HxlR family transcriptional regulator
VKPSATQITVLRALADGPKTALELHRPGVAPGVAAIPTTTLDALRRRGLVERRPNDPAHLPHLWSITDQGREARTAATNATNEEA